MRSAETTGPSPLVLADPQAVRRDQVRALYAQSPLGAVIAFGLGGLFVYVYARVTPAWMLGLWFSAIVASQLSSRWQLRRFRLLSAQDDWDPDPWLRIHLVHVLVAAVLMGAIAWMFFVPTYGEARWLSTLTVCGLAAGSITSYAYHRPTMLAFVLVLAAPMAVKLASLPGQSGVVGCAVFLFYIGMVMWFGDHQARLLRESIEMRHANAALLEALRVRSRDLEASHQARSRFFAAASHDLRQPLHALGYYSSLLQPHAQDAPHVQRIEQCLGALDDLLEGVLDIARLDAGNVQPHATHFDLGAQLRRLATLYDGAAGVKGLRVQVHLPRGGAWACTDEQMLERVLANLVNNAIRYTPRGGLLLAVQARAGRWRISVIDTGIGIAPESQHEVFEEFVQLHNRERDASQGVGLGLATVKRICSLLGHELGMRSRVGHGSSFWVLVPRGQPVEHAAPAAAPGKGDLLTGRVLLVEDNTLVGDSLRQTLQQWGLDCELVADGSAALARARERVFDAVLCDWRLPGELDGAEVLRALNELQPQPRLRVLLTGERDDKIGDLPAGIPVLRKPVRPIRLRALLSAHLDRQTEARAGGSEQAAPAPPAAQG